MSLESKLTQLEKYLNLSREQGLKPPISFTNEEWEKLNDEKTPLDEKEAILVKHNVKKGLWRKVYIGISPDDWDDEIDDKIMEQV